MAKKSTTQLFTEVMQIVKSQTEKVPTSKRLMLAGFVLMHAIAHVVEGLSREGTAEDQKEIAAAAKQAYHDVIAPIDIPGIPNYIEPFIDNYIETAIGAGSEFGLKYIHEIHEQIDELLKESA